MSDMTPSDRRELRSIVKKQFQVLRAEVKRRTDEMKSEIETDLLRRYRKQDESVAAARAEVEELTREVSRQLLEIRRRLIDAQPELTVEVGFAYRKLQLDAHDSTRSQLHKAAIAAIPTKIQEAMTHLDQDEIGLLRELTVGALTTDDAREFMARIPSVGTLVPTARMPQIDSSGVLS